MLRPVTGFWNCNLRREEIVGMGLIGNKTKNVFFFSPEGLSSSFLALIQQSSWNNKYFSRGRLPSWLLCYIPFRSRSSIYVIFIQPAVDNNASCTGPRKTTLFLLLLFKEMLHIDLVLFTQLKRFSLIYYHTVHSEWESWRSNKNL